MFGAMEVVLVVEEDGNRQGKRGKVGKDGEVGR